MKLSVFSSQRALLEFAKNSDSAFLPPCKSIGEFFEYALSGGNITQTSQNLRILFLWRAIKNIEISDLGFEKSFISFLEHSNFIFQFFDELDSANVKISDIDTHDTYGDYSDHLSVLERIYEKYQSELAAQNLSNKNHKINQKFLQTYDEIDIFLGGILSAKELQLLRQIAESTHLTLFFTTTKYNLNLLQNILSQNLSQNTHYSLCLNDGKLREKGALQRHTKQINLYKFDLRISQVLLVIAKINEWLSDGAQSIAVILPDENFAKYLQLFEKNLNYAMGFRDIKLIKKVQNLRQKSCDEILEAVKNDFDAEIFAMREILATLSSDEIIEFLLKNIKNLDDNNGGKVRVMGILESRLIKFERVIIVDFNSEFIPALNDNDMFLNTALRKRLNLPTLRDKENLQRHYYFMLINNAEFVEIACCKNAPVASLLNDLGELCEVAEFDGDKMWHFYEVGEAKKYFDDKIIAKVPQMRLSASSIKIFLDCKRKFYFSYLCEKLRSSEEKEEFLGTKIHNLLCEMGQDFNLHKIRAFAESYAQSERLDLEIMLKKLSAFFREQSSALKNGAKILAVEKSVEFAFGGFDFTCKIDRIDKVGEKIRIIDYKLQTDILGKNGFLQLLIYKLAIEREYGSCEIECLYFDLLNNKEIIMDESAELSAKEMLHSALGALGGEVDFARCEDIKPCKYCDYVYLCERY
ncbi:PD-(D/E)XK nuclease family protein [Helicobacter sp. 23-1044]